MFHVIIILGYTHYQQPAKLRLFLHIYKFSIHFFAKEIDFIYYIWLNRYFLVPLRQIASLIMTRWRLTFLFALCYLPLAADISTGVCGDNLSWSFDTETGHLDITGSGDMNLNKYPAWTTKNNIIITSVSFPDSITSIDMYAFEEQALTDVVVPASVKKFGRNAFGSMPTLLRFTYEGEGYADVKENVLYNCYNLRYFKGITRMLSYNNALDSVIVTYGYASTNFSKLSYIDNTHAYDTRLSGKYDTIPKKIKTLFLPDGLETIGNFLLCNAPDLGGIIIPEKVQSIGKGAFLNCTALDSLIFMGDTIREIGDSAFCHCTNLGYMRLQDTIPPTIYEHTFDSVNRNIPIYIPANCIQRYQEAPFWSEFFNFIEPAPTTPVENIPFGSTPSHSADFNARKYLNRGRLLILKGNRSYTITGQEIQ